MKNWTTCDTRNITAIVVGLWLTFSFIGPGYDVLTANAVPRIGMIFSIVQDRTLQIDKVAAIRSDRPLVIDKAFFAEHFYSDKAPGMSLMALPFVAPTVWLAAALGHDTTPVRDGWFTDFFLLIGHVACMFTSGAAVALSSSTVYLLTRRLGMSSHAALIGSLGYGIATPAFGWATAFFGHVTAGAFLFLGFALIASADLNTNPRRRMLLGAAIGGALTWSFVVEYTTGLSAVIVGLFGLGRLLRSSRPVAGQILTGLFAGAAIALLPLLIHNQIAFGSALTIGYQYVVGFDAMKQSMGFSLPRPWVAWELVFGSFRGLLWLSPVLALLPWAWYAASRKLPGDLVAVVVAIPMTTLVVNAGYFDWGGGGSTGPRHLVPSMAFAGFALAPLWDSLRSWVTRGLLITLLVVSSAISIVCASVTMGASNPDSVNLLGFILGYFIAGDIHNILLFSLKKSSSLDDLGAARLLTLFALPAFWLFALGLARLVARSRCEPTLR